MSDTPKKLNKLRIHNVIIIAIIVVLVITLLSFLVTNKKSGGTKLSMPFGVGSAVVLSGSMEPALSVDDLVFFTKTDDVKVGDVVVYYNSDSDMMTVHRIVEMSDDGQTVTTQGDANNTADDPISVSDVQGKMVFAIDGAGRIIAALRNPIVIILILAILFVAFFMPVRREKKKED